MSKIIGVIEQETDGKSYNSLKYSFDSFDAPTIEYDANERDKKTKGEHGETENHKKKFINLSREAENRSGEQLIKYFLDGSRRTFKIDDISYNEAVYPIIAGQIGVGCCKRVDRKMSPEKLQRKFVLSLPNKANWHGWDDRQFCIKLRAKINENQLLRKIGIRFSEILFYDPSKAENNRAASYESLGISKIQDLMCESEKAMVEELVKEGKLGQDSYLLKDGSIEYQDSSSNGNIRTWQQIKNNYSWVIGVSKSFNPELCFNATEVADLPLFYRTRVIKYKSERAPDVSFGIWYVRIRGMKYTITPFDGIVKVEKVIMDDEKGLNSEEVDKISANVINERNPVCYGTDKRWANHLYPVFITESYVKSKYLSNEFFLNLF